MHTSVSVRGKNIDTQLNLHAIRIWNNDELSNLLSTDPEAATDELTLCIQAEYVKLFDTAFKVSNASIAVEIWAHVYAEKFAEAVKSFSEIQFIDKLADKIIHHAEIIDIGEKGHDNNRFIWDGLAVFKSAIAALLFAGKSK
jgi:hypothetical protein